MKPKKRILGNKNVDREINKIVWEKEVIKPKKKTKKIVLEYFHKWLIVFRMK